MDRVYDLMDQLWVRDANNEQLANFRDFTNSVLAGMASEGYTQNPGPCYWRVLREIERRQLKTATVAALPDPASDSRRL